MWVTKYILLNNILISDLSSDSFNQIYRGELNLVDKADTLLSLELLKDEKVYKYVLEKYQLFK